MKDPAKILKAIGLVFGVLFLTYLLGILPFIGSFFVHCPDAIYGRENTIGVRIYLNGEFAGVMEKYTYKRYEKQHTDIRLCTKIKGGDHLRAEKEGYETYTTTLDPSIDVSNSPSAWVWIKLTPLAEEEKTKAP